jgi:two-component system nitrate/nitrite response regulator NarL
MEPERNDESLPDVRVLIVADGTLAGSGIATLLDGQRGLIVAGQTAVVDDLVRTSDAYSATALVWDLGTTGGALDLLAEDGPHLPPTVVLLSNTALAARAWAAGARGLLHRDVTPSRLAVAIHAVVEGAAVLDDAFANALVPRAEPQPELAEPLTPREVEVLRLLADGHPNKAIALALEVTENTIKFHMNAILGKLGAQSRTEAVTRAIRAGLIPL